MSQQLAQDMARILPAESGSAVPGPCQPHGVSERCAQEPAPCPEGQIRAKSLVSRGRRDRNNEERFISRGGLRELFPVSDMTIWRWTRDPEIAFPAPVKLGRNGRNFWWLPAIHDWGHRRQEISRRAALPGQAGSLMMGGAAQDEPHGRAQGGRRIPVFRPPDPRSRNGSISESAYHPPGDMDPKGSADR
jgi:predicted DNA-binding transcriptional regulator AlpA